MFFYISPFLSVTGSRSIAYLYTCLQQPAWTHQREECSADAHLFLFARACLYFGVGGNIKETCSIKQEASQGLLSLRLSPKFQLPQYNSRNMQHSNCQNTQHTTTVNHEMAYQNDDYLLQDVTRLFGCIIT